MRGTSDLGARASTPAVLTRRLRRAGEGVRIDVVKDTDDDGAVIALATLMPEAGRAPLSGAFLRLAVEAAVTLADGVALRISSPAVTPAEARGFADAGFVTTSELHLLTHDLTGSARPAASSGVRLRRGSARDTPEALRVDAAAFAPGWTMSAHGLANARNATPITRLRVATVQGRDRAYPQLAGYALTGRAGRRGYLQRLAVDPTHHRKGIGAALVLDAIRWSRRRGVHHLVVNTQVGNEPALALYRQLGFTESDARLYTMELQTPVGTP